MMTRLETIGRHKTAIATHDGMTRVRYHSTDVVCFNHETIILDSGGWETVTTKRRINQTSRQFDLGISVYQRDYQWYVETPDGKILEFFDGMKIPR